MVIQPDTLTRLSADETAGLSFDGGPASVRLSFLSDGTEQEWDGPFGDGASKLPVHSLPERVTVTWQVSGADVSAALDIVASRTCSLEDIRGYRPQEYANGSVSDADAFRARARAEEVIERAMGRHLQPVLREGWCDRPGCRTTTLLSCGDGTAYDLARIVRAQHPDGSGASVRILPGSPCVLDVSRMRPGTAASVVAVTGMSPIPAEAHDAVMLLASWMLVPRVGPDNATSTSTDNGVLRFVVGGVDGAATSLPEGNAFIGRNRVRDWQVG